MSTLIIAEAGVNHNGNLDLAKRLALVAKKAGADIVKFQTWITEQNIAKNAPKAEYQKANDGEGSQFDMVKKLELTFDQFRDLKKYCDKIEIQFLSTPDEKESLDFLIDDLGLKLIKIGSGEVTNIPLLRNVGRKKIDVILSTGMSNIEEIQIAFQELKNHGAKSITLLHCTSDYPACFEDLNLKAISTLRQNFNVPIGFSDHSLGIEASIAAVSLGATIIEKHFTLDKAMPGPDHVASLSPEELTLMIKQIRNIEFAIAGDGKKIPTSRELKIKKIVQKGIYIRHNLDKGQIIKEVDLMYLRPVGTIPVSSFDQVIGRRLKVNKKSGEALIWDDFE